MSTHNIHIHDKIRTSLKYSKIFVFLSCRKNFLRSPIRIRIRGPEIIELSTYSTQLSMKFVLLINLKLRTIAHSFLLDIAEHENFSGTKYKNAN